MARVTISTLSRLGPCWSAERMTGQCVKCQRVERCVLPEAKLAVIELRHEAVLKADELAKQARLKEEQAYGDARRTLIED